MKFSRIFAPTHTPAPVPRAALAPKRPKPKDIYSSIVSQAKNLVLGFASRPARMPELEAIAKAVEETSDALELARSKILAFVDRSTPEDSLPGHLANVSILTLAVGKKMGFSEDVQTAAGAAAILHHSANSINRSYLGTLNPAARAVIEGVLWTQ